jgi:hypothetical protein
MRRWTANQLVAYNLAKARELKSWTQEQAVAAVNAVDPPTQWSKITWSAAERSVDWKRIRQFTADDLLAFCRAFDLPLTWWLRPPGSEDKEVWLFSEDPDGAPPQDWVTGQDGILKYLLDPAVVVGRRLARTGFSPLVDAMVDEEPDTQRWQDFADALEGVHDLVKGALDTLRMRRPEDPTIGAERREREAAFVKRIAPDLTTDEIEKIKTRASEPITKADLEALPPGTEERMRRPMTTPGSDWATKQGETRRADAKKAATGQKVPTKQPAARRRTTRREQ